MRPTVLSIPLGSANTASGAGSPLRQRHPGIPPILRCPAGRPQHRQESIPAAFLAPRHGGVDDPRRVPHPFRMGSSFFGFPLAPYNRHRCGLCLFNRMQSPLSDAAYDPYFGWWRHPQFHDVGLTSSTIDLLLVESVMLAYMQPQRFVQQWDSLSDTCAFLLSPCLSHWALATEGEHTYLSDFHSTNYTYPQGDGRLVRRGTSSLRSTSPPGDGSMRCRGSGFMAGDLPSNI